MESRALKRMSIIIPAYNEEASIGMLLTKIENVSLDRLDFEKEIIVVDDASQDRTLEVASRFKGVRCLRQDVNQGKGRAVQRGIQECTGDYILVQDADLEYEPEDYPFLVAPLQGNPSTAVYGSRAKGQWLNNKMTLFPGRHPKQSLGSWIAGVVLTLWTMILYRRWITDTLTAYKIYPSETVRGFSIKTNGFETDHEITAKLIRAGIPIVEVPIRYNPRSVEEGKKIKARDGLIAVWTLLRFRFLN